MSQNLNSFRIVGSPFLLHKKLLQSNILLAVYFTGAVVMFGLFFYSMDGLLSEWQRVALPVMIPLICFALVGYINYKHIIYPVQQMSSFLSREMSGEDKNEVPYLKRKDEIGDIARALAALGNPITVASVAEKGESISAARLQWEKENEMRSDKESAIIKCAWCISLSDVIR